MNKPYDRQRIFDLELIGRKQLIYDVTRPISATVIDHIYVSHNQFIVDSGVIQWSLSDHNIVWCARQHRNMFKKSGSFKWITYRSYKTLDQLAFQHDLLQANLCDCSTANRDVDSAWKDWLNRFTIVLDAHAPIRRKNFSLVPLRGLAAMSYLPFNIGTTFTRKPVKIVLTKMLGRPFVKLEMPSGRPFVMLGLNITTLSFLTVSLNRLKQPGMKSRN